MAPSARIQRQRSACPLFSAQEARPVPAASSSSPGSVVVRAGTGPIAHCADAAARRHRVGAERAGAEAAQGRQRTGAERAQRPGPKPSRNRPDRRTMLIQCYPKSTFSEIAGETHTHDTSAELPQRRDRQGPQAAAQVAGTWTRIMGSGVRKVGIHALVRRSATSGTVEIGEILGFRDMGRAAESRRPPPCPRPSAGLKARGTITSPSRRGVGRSAIGVVGSGPAGTTAGHCEPAPHRNVNVPSQHERTFLPSFWG